MSRQRHTAEQIIGKLREAEVLQAKGMSMEVACEFSTRRVDHNCGHVLLIRRLRESAVPC
ncbi:MAG: hypothetical protein ABSF91_12875 [Bacteroidota bacterium]